MIVCAQCGRENPADARFCLACGSRLEAPAAEAREERKVVSVLFADLVGFTARSEQLDPEDVRATLTPYYARLRHELERRGGTVEKFIGDAVMAVFGAPLAHEDDPERAVRAALAIRDAIAEDGQLQVRAAVTTGEALVSLGAAPAEGEGMVAGDVVNTAARLQAAAPVNGVLVDETTYRATRGSIAYGEADPVSAKGKSEPVPVWEAQEARSRFGVDVVQAGAALVGRRREVDLLADALARAREERSPQLVTLIGVPGIGKSRLVYELSRVVDAQPDLVYWRQGRSLPYGEGVTYWALAEMAKAQAGILETDTPDDSGRKLAEAVAALGLERSDSILESLRTLVGVGGEVDARGDRTEHFAAWRQFFEGLADQRPAVLVFEDLHWADDDLLDFVDHLVDWGSGVPLLVVCTARPELLERRPGWGGGKPNALTLSISPLSEDETARLLAALLERSVLPAELQRTLLARAGGNPLYAEQFARLLEEGGRDDLPLPENVQGIIAARLDGLPPGEKQLLQDAAVFGKVFWSGAVCAVGERDRSEAEAALHALERKEFVRRERRSSVGSEEEYAFRHLLVRDVAYGQIPRAARADRHEGAAEWIEALGRPEDHGEMLAHHYLEALRLGRESGLEVSEAVVERARRAARDAGDRALALGAFAVAARFFEAALELWAEDDERPELLLAYLRSRMEDPAVDDALFEEARDRLLEAGKVAAAAEAEARLGTTWMLRGDQQEALRHVERAGELVETCPASPEKAFVLQEQARLLMMAEDNDRAIEIANESLRIAEGLGLDAARSRNLNTIGCARAIVGDAGGIADLEHAIEIAAAANSHEEVSARANLHSMVIMVGDLERARELHVQTQQVAERLGLIGFIDWQRGEHAVHCYLDGRWDEALTTADDFIREVEAGRSHYMEVACRFARGLIWVARGQLDDALAEFRRATELARIAKDPQVLNPSLGAEGRALLAAADARGASALADELLEGWRSVPPRQAAECSEGAYLFRGLGRQQELLDVLEAVRGPSPWHEAARRYLSGDLVGAAETYAVIGTLPDETYSRIKAAEQFVSAGDRAAADAQLGLALPVLVQLGAAAWRAEAESLLAESA